MNEQVETANELYVGTNITIMGLEAGSDMEALDILAGTLHREGIVKDSYIPAVKEREKTYSTGLVFPDMGIAIPHTDAEHVNEGAIGIAICKNPVPFRPMDMSEEYVPAEMMFMMAIKQAHSQIEFLQKLMAMFTTEGLLKKLKASKSAEELVKAFKENL